MSLLDGLLGNENGTSGVGKPMMLILLGLLASRRLGDHGEEGHGGTAGTPAAPSPAPSQGAKEGSSFGGLAGMLGGLIGGSAGNSGSIVNHGLTELVQHFTQAGQGEKAQSWISNGANQPVSAQELERVLGPDRIQWLQEKTGLSANDILSHLSRELPNAVDKLTPNAHIPAASEAPASA